MKEWGGENRRKASCFLPAEKMVIYVRIHGGFPGGSGGKESARNAGDPDLIPGLGRSPEEGNGNPLPVFLPGESHRQRSLAGYSPWGHKESGTTE